MKRSYKYRIYLNQQQTQALQQVFAFCRFLYNSALEERKSYYKKYGKSIFYEDQCKQLPGIKEIFPDQTKLIFSQTLQSTLRALQKAYDNFFRKIKNKEKSPGHPRFKNVNNFKSITFPQCNLKAGGVKLVDKKHLQIWGLEGLVGIKLHRLYGGKVKTVQIKKEGDKYFLILSCDEVPQKILAKTGKEVGIDLGINNFITTDTGEIFHHPKQWRTAKEKLAYHNRKLDRKKKDSNNRKKSLISLQKAHQKIHNIRTDWQHKMANQLIKNYDIIYIEDLNIKNMMEKKEEEKENQEKKNIARRKSLMDAALGIFVQLLKYKAESAGKVIIELDPYNTSKKCYGCKKINHNLLPEDVIFLCPSCQYEENRDLNAARNIRELGISYATEKISVSEITIS